MELKKLRIAVVSDLHCHPERAEYSKNNSYLFSDKLRSPNNEHPVENLLELIKKESLQVDLVLSPGDFTDHCDKQGFLSGWSYVNEISQALKAKDVVATIGNHDVDSRHIYSQYSFDIAKKIKQNFPLKEEQILKDFWANGYAFIEEQDYQILVINSTHFHTHYNKENEIENPAIKGKIDLTQVEEIEKYLIVNNNPSKIKITLCHHHPVDHSRFGLGEHDVIENGQELMNVLGKHKFDLIIHGHKHDPWLRYINTSSGFLLPILSSGSFSATNQIIFTTKFNYFHIIEIQKDSQSLSTGKIDTLTYKNKIGWKRDKDDGFYPYTGFGFLDDLNIIVDEIEEIMSNFEVTKWEFILSKIPSIENLIPDKIEELQDRLKLKKIYLSGKIGLKPLHIYKSVEDENR